jgi:PAS domain S-box-containing protein
MTASRATLPGAHELYAHHVRTICEHTDRLFAGLMLVQWVAAIAAAYWITPRAWVGSASTIHLHVWAAVFLGGAVSLFPVALALLRPGLASTRYVIATAQMLMSSLLIHFTGGRIETHFHVFGSLAFLSFYRDWRVLVPATIVVAADHFLRGVFWPESVFGVLSASNWRWLEHAGWVVFEDIFLVGACRRAHREMWSIAERTAELHATQDRYRAIVDRAEGVFLADAVTGTVLESNAAFGALLGVDSELAQSFTLYQFDVGPRHELDAAIGRLLEQKLPIQLERRYRHADGSLLDVTLNLSALAHGTKDVLCGAVRDITEHKRADQELLASKARKAAIVEAAFDCIITIDGTGTICEFNPAAEQTFGWTRAAAVGKDFVDLIVPPADRERYHAELAQDVAIGTNTIIGRRVEAGAMRADGTGFAAEFAIARILCEGVPMFTFFMRDISGPKEAEAALRASEAQLRQAQKMDAIGQLAGGVAHDFNNLLTGILGYAELAADQLGKDHPVSPDIAEITRAGQSAAALTRQLLTFSRKQVVLPEVLDLNTVLSGVDKMLRRLIGEQIELVTTLEPRLRCVEADAGQIEQVIVNLVVNARSAMRQGGLLRLETANVDVVAGERRHEYGLLPGAYVMLLVGDTGCGMDAEVQAHLFEPFFTTKPPGEGTGLGLSTTYAIVKQSGGSILIESAPGQGSTFRIFLPGVEQQVRRVPEPETTRAPYRATETLLLVEDDSVVRALARRALQSAGYVVFEASSPHEALRIADRHPGAIHLILSDIVMPDMSGPALVERLWVRRPETKVLLMSGYTEDALTAYAIANRSLAFLPKPFTSKILIRRVREVLDSQAGNGSSFPASVAVRDHTTQRV